jgi:hypothetical protein
MQNKQKKKWVSRYLNKSKQKFSKFKYAFSLNLNMHPLS